MFKEKIYVIAFCLALVGTVLGQSKTEENKGFKISDELKVKANSLLTVLARESDQFYLPENRVFARAQVANLLWARDEKQARQLFQSAVSELETMISGLDVEDLSEDEKYMRIYEIGELRREVLFQIAKHDAAYALSAFKTLSPKKPTGEDLFDGDSDFELELAKNIAQNDPKLAFEVAKSQIENGYPYGLIDTLEQIYSQDKELGGKLAVAIFSKIKDQNPVLKPATSANSNKAVNPLETPMPEDQPEITMWQIKEFAEKVRVLNRRGVKDKKSPALAESEYKELIGIFAKKFLGQQYGSAYEIAGFMNEIDAYFPVSGQSIRRKLNSEKASLDQSIRESALTLEMDDKSANEIVAWIERKPIAQRDDLYLKAAQVFIDKGDAISAKELHSKAVTKPEYDYVAEQIELLLPYALADQGNIDEVREMIATLKAPEEKIKILTTLAQSLAAKGNIKLAKELTEEARALYSGKLKSRKNLGSIVELSGATAVFAPEQSFAFLESNVFLINEIIAAGIVIDEFNDSWSIKDNELLLKVVQTESFQNMPKGVALLRNLSNADFERTIGIADRFARREAKFFAKFRIVQALLDPNAEEIEKVNQVIYEGEGC